MLKLIGALFAYSTAVDVLAFPIGVGFPIGMGGAQFVGYYQKLNWVLFPVFWFVIVPLAYATWGPFQRAWREAATTGVLHSGKAHNVTPMVVDELITEIERARPMLGYWSVLLALIANYADVHGLAACYIDRAACAGTENDFSLVWFYLGDASLKAANGLFVVLAYAQQLVLSFFAILALLQILFHSLLPIFIHRFKVSQREGLCATLNHRSALREFGMENWNYALNNAYWLISAGLIVPILSRYSQAGRATLDTGQLLLQCFVPVVVLGPMIATIIVRQLLLRGVWSRLDHAKPEDVELFHKQMIWPLDRNWSSKLGLIVAFALLSYLIGVAPFGALIGKVTG